MKSSNFTVSVASAILLLSACARQNPPVTPDDGENSSESFVASSDASITSEGTEWSESTAVLYRGTLEEAGPSIYMQGTHRLSLEDGRSLLLESSTLALEAYEGRRVEVRGAVRPTVEAGGLIMRVESVQLLDASSASSDVSSSSASSTLSASVVSRSEAPSSIARSVPPPASSPASVPASRAPAASSVTASTPSWQASDELTAKAAVMAQENLSADRWTQRYCSTHIKFCIPVHKNWWFKSFGATSSSLWHVEIGPQPMENLGEGPISVNLLSGTVESAGGSDKLMSVQGDSAVGFRAWDDNRHFEIRGPSSLEQAIRYLTEQLQPSGD